MFYFASENRLLISGKRRFSILSAEFTVPVGPIPGVLLEVVLLGFMEADIDNHLFVVAVAPTRSEILLPEVHVR